MIEHFLTVDRLAVQYIKNHKVFKKSFKELYHDIYRMIGLFKKKNLKPKDKVAIFIPPYQYIFYVTLFAGMLYQLNLVVFDSYEKKHLKELVQIEKLSYCFVDNKTRFLSMVLLPKCKKICVSSFSKYREKEAPAFHEDSILLTTFTSGTTGTPKPIYRTISFLLKQVEQIKYEINLNLFSVVFGGLPIYNILSIYSLKTTCIARKLKTIAIFKPDCVLTTIQKILTEKRSYPEVKNVMLGGAILYSWEAKKSKEVFPKAQITYVYGASEGAIIYKTNLDSYIKNPFIFDIPAKDINVTIEQKNFSGVGEIVIYGDKVNTLNHMHYTGDLGRLENGKLILVGRKKYSSLELGIYNYCLDEELRMENETNIFTFYYDQKIYVVSEKKLKHKREGFYYITMKQLPMDLKHKTKLNYQECIKQINKQKNK
ncbi:MAG: AMP-binding protein [Anaeroplasmataceae bacterium]|nr:AMP-binding protein [Anaeroplasmataceae bacterium]